MGLISKTRLTALTESKLGYRAFSEAVNESKQENKYYATVTVFLSHSHDDIDNDYVKKVIVLLRRVGVRVYIDSQDSSMPPFTNAETATRIKQAIKDNKKFVLLATNSSINSKWCNWELGFGDAYKYISNIALFPLTESSGLWDGTEYLRIYPRIQESDNQQENYDVVFPDGTKKTLVNWLTS